MKSNSNNIEANSLCQIEIPARNVEAALEFYALAFGWERAPVEIHNYFVLKVPKGNPFGISIIPCEREAVRGPSPVVYFVADGVVDKLKQITELGGKAIWGPKPVPGVGLVAQFEDPEGNRWGLREKSFP